MTREEAIALLNCAATELVGTLGEGGDVSVVNQSLRYIEALDMAIAALRERGNCCKNGNSSWISVEDRLPEDWKKTGGDLINYLVFMPEYGVDVGNYAKPVKTWLCMGIPCKVTHWMPLPEPPKEEPHETKKNDQTADGRRDPAE